MCRNPGSTGNARTKSRRSGVRASVVARTRGNARGAKGTQEGGWRMKATTEYTTQRLSFGTRPRGAIQDHVTGLKLVVEAHRHVDDPHGCKNDILGRPARYA